MERGSELGSERSQERMCYNTAASPGLLEVSLGCGARVGSKTSELHGNSWGHLLGRGPALGRDSDGLYMGLLNTLSEHKTLLILLMCPLVSPGKKILSLPAASAFRSLSSVSGLEKGEMLETILNCLVLP